MAAYLSQAFMIDEMYICGENLDQLKVRTVLSNTKTNIFAKIRLIFLDKSLKSEYVFPISECKLCEKNNTESSLIRLELSGKKFFAHRQRTIMINEELVKAVFN